MKQPILQYRHIDSLLFTVLHATVRYLFLCVYFWKSFQKFTKFHSFVSSSDASFFQPIKSEHDPHSSTSTVSPFTNTSDAHLSNSTSPFEPADVIVEGATGGAEFEPLVPTKLSQEAIKRERYSGRSQRAHDSFSYEQVRWKKSQQNTLACVQLCIPVTQRHCRVDPRFLNGPNAKIFEGPCYQPNSLLLCAIRPCVRVFW